MAPGPALVRRGYGLLPQDIPCPRRSVGGRIFNNGVELSCHDKFTPGRALEASPRGTRL